MEKSKNSELVYPIISAAFCVIVVVSNIISAKMVKLPLFHDLSIPAGLITYPLAFLLSNLVTEIYGKARAQAMVYIALGMNVLAFSLIQCALLLPSGAGSNQSAFESVMGLGGLRIFSSLTAFLLAQLVDIQLYALIKRWTADRFLWLRNNGSTLMSQMVDTVVIDMIFLYWGMGMGLDQVFPIMVFSYTYKALFTVANTPLLYLLIFLNRFKKRMRLSHEPQ